MSKAAWRTAGVIVGGWTLYGLLMTFKTMSLTSLGGKQLDWWRALTVEMAFGWEWALITPLVLWAAKKYPVERGRLVRNLAIHFALCCVLTAATKLTWDFSVARWLLPKWGTSPWNDPKRLATSVIYMFDYGVMQYVTLLVFERAGAYSRRTAEVAAQLARAQLQALQMQLQPHFLFNTLHSISQLVHENPDAAERMIARLGDFLRLTLKHRESQEISLAQELVFLERYLDIEKMRFADRLRVDMDVDEAVLSSSVPALILQPLVENAFHHGLVEQRQAGVLRIGARRENGSLRLEVADNGPGLRAEREGVGLSNVRERLKKLYGDQGRLTLANAPQGGLLATIEIPAV